MWSHDRGMMQTVLNAGWLWSCDYGGMEGADTGALEPDLSSFKEVSFVGGGLPELQMVTK